MTNLQILTLVTDLDRGTDCSYFYICCCCSRMFLSSYYWLWQTIC